jgi:2-phosphosulfolactate phosphatase
MQVDLAMSPLDLPRFSDLSRWNIAVIDVLRATSSMVSAAAAGCKRIIPVEGIEEAHALAAEIASDRPVLAGERGGLKPEGFKLGNSPSEFTPEAVGGRTVIMATSNGSRAFKKVEHGRRVFAVSFLNLTASAEGLAHEGQDVLIVCAGTEAAPGLEDVACGGALAHKVRELAGAGCLLSDSALIARNTYGAYPDILAVLWRSAHGRYLESIGLGADLETCAGQDRHPLLLILEDGAVVATGLPPSS